MKNKNILISGAGIAGLTLAYWLKKYGFNPVIIEKHSTLRAEGYKIDIRGKAVEVIKKMDLRNEIYEARTAIREARFVNSTGKSITQTHPDLCGTRVTGDLEIVRGTLCEILYENLQDVECIFGDSIVELNDNGKGVEVTFQHRSPRQFDLVIGADGLHSKVRRLAWGSNDPFLKELGLYVSYYSIPNYLNLDCVEIEYHLPGKFVIAYCPRDGLAKCGFAFAAKSKDTSDPKKLIHDTFADAGWEVPQFLEYMKDTPDFYFDCMAQVDMPHWNKGRIALAGDAGYAVSPVAGQGASLALVGAYILAGELAEAHGDHSKAFAEYEKEMKTFVLENQKLAKMSASILTGRYSSWFAAKLLWVSHRLGQLLPGKWIEYWKKKGQKRTAEAANAIQLKNYSQRTFIHMLRDPRTHQEIVQHNNSLMTKDGKQTFRITEGIPSFLQDGDVTGDNAKYQKFYDKVGRFTGSIFWFVCRLFRLDTVTKRKELLSDLEIAPGDQVLETSIGAGANIPPLTKDAEYFGVDISFEMLRACQRYPLIEPYQLQLIQANAEQLPFKDNSFDVVFHIGGINFFNDIPQAIQEMIRVAKPGAQIMIGDETQEHVDSWYCKLPFVRHYFENVKPVSPPLDFIPQEMKEVKIEHKWNNSMYIITFRKP